MARYRKLDLRTWSDQKFKELTALPCSGQSVWLVLVLGPQTTNIPGLFEASEVSIADRFNWSVEDFRKAFREASTRGMAKADWKARLVWLPKAPEYNKPESPNVVVSWGPVFDELPECDLKREAYQSLKDFAKGWGQGYSDAFDRALREPSVKAMPNQEQEQEQEQDQEQKIDIRPERSVDNPGIDPKAPNGTESLDSVSPDAPPAAAAKKCTSERREKRADVEAVFKHWQVMWGHPTSKLDRKRQARIEARLKEGFTVEQLCNAIAGFKHSPWHNGTDPNGNGTVYDGIETLLRGAEQVEKGLAFHAAPPKANGNANVAGAFAAWDRVAQHVKGAYRNGLLGDERVDKIVAYIGGYTRLAMSNTHELGTYRVRFIQAWKDGAP